VPYEFSGLYMFGMPLPALDDEIAKTPAHTAAVRDDLVRMLEAEALPAEETASSFPAQA
jgi:hypothetical protein